MAITDTETFEESVGKIAGLLGDELSEEEEKEPEKVEEEEPEAEAREDTEAEEAESEEEEAEAEEEAEEEGEEETPDIDPPASMTEAQKEAFRALPKEQKEFLAEQHKGFQRDYTKRSQEIAEDRKAAQSETEAAKTERRYLKEALGVTLRQLQGDLSAGISDQELAQLQRTDPAKFAAASEMRRQARERLQAVQGAIQATMRRDAEESAKELDRKLTEAAKKLPEMIPEWSDPKVRQTEQRDLYDYGLSLGFTEQEMSTISDPRAVVVLRKARLYDKLQSDKARVSKKVSAAPKKTATPKAGTRAAPEKSDFSEARKRLKTTGSVDSAAAAIAKLLPGD